MSVQQSLQPAGPSLRLPPPPPAQGSQSRAQKCLLARDETPALKPASGRNPRPGLLPEQTAARCRSAVPERRGSR